MKATILICAIAAGTQAVRVAPMPIGEQASVDRLDESRQAHTDTVLKYLAGNTFQGYWNDLKRYHEVVVSQGSYNAGDKEYTMDYPRCPDRHTLY